METPDILIVGLDAAGVDLARELLEDRQSLRVIGIGTADAASSDLFDLVLGEPLDLRALERGVEV